MLEGSLPGSWVLSIYETDLSVFCKPLEQRQQIYSKRCHNQTQVPTMTSDALLDHTSHVQLFGCLDRILSVSVYG